ncbi:hypothetical protein DOTSEDRAFT_38483 [Dothistroma septosporum NZE10]|uniref:Heterokaryon incompatibility domain-containing protein n=1 Tax=Dothistroma septosporum (strain NZE10 / CBS 128990) TaxID=675120 RepID=M2WJY0_DOTSN|nr:hypothetical protein DOTSEDRAFT_38483 [Dothistroma septosporum NZE10]
MPSLGLLPGERPSRIGNREFDFAQHMEEEVMAIKGPAEDYDIVMIANTSSSARDADEGSLLVRCQPHIVRPAKDTGVGFATDEDGSVTLELNDPPNASRYQLDSLRLTTPHRLCLACTDAFNYFFASLIAFAEIDKCHLCQELAKNLQQRCPRAFEVDNSSRFRTELCWKRNSKLGDEITLYFVLAHPTAKRDVWNPTHFYRARLWPKQMFGKYFDVQDKLGSSMPALASTSSGLERSIVLALQWLEKCRANTDGKHDQCCEQAGNFRYPNRVLDVSTALRTKKLKLVSPVYSPELFKNHRDFITLSHCWGKWGAEHSPKLTSTNVENRFSSGLDLHDIPKSFQQALQVTDWFGIRWLWIDCLCIIQDSLEDWLLEASLMADNYKNAILNISADAFDDARQGCLVDRDPLDIIPPAIRAPALGQEWYLIPTDDHLFDWMSDAPSSSRAWIHRERQLSKRILHFTAKEIVWECCGTEEAGFASEVFAGGAPFKRTFNKENKFQMAAVLDEEMDAAEIHASWNDVCEALSRKELTKAADMPIVLSSIAKEFDAIPPAGAVEYICGMWRSEFPECLLWDSVRHVRVSKEIIAPSWSWLSVASAVNLNHRIVPSQWWQDALARVEDITTELKYSDQPFGPLEKGTVTMTGYLRRISLTFREDGHRVDLSVYDEHKLRRVGSSWDDYLGDLCNLSMDGAIDEMEVDCFCFFVAIKQWNDVDSSRSIACLLLQAVKVDGNSNTYRRIGTIDFEDLFALKMSYRVVSASTDDNAKWEQLRSDIEQMQTAIAQSMASEDEESADDGLSEHATDSSVQREDAVEADEERGDPSLLYQYDADQDLSWLAQLVPQTIKLI